MLHVACSYCLNYALVEGTLAEIFQIDVLVEGTLAKIFQNYALVQGTLADFPKTPCWEMAGHYQNKFRHSWGRYVSSTDIPKVNREEQDRDENGTMDNKRRKKMSKSISK